MKIEIGKTYRLNEDMKRFIKLKDNASIEPIKYGTECKVIEIDGEYITLEFANGRKVRTLDHMISE